MIPCFPSPVAYSLLLPLLLLPLTLLRCLINHLYYLLLSDPFINPTLLCFTEFLRVRIAEGGSDNEGDDDSEDDDEDDDESNSKADSHSHASEAIVMDIKTGDPPLSV